MAQKASRPLAQMAMDDIIGTAKQVYLANDGDWVAAVCRNHALIHGQLSYDQLEAALAGLLYLVAERDIRHGR
jgi:hypothetical protein